MTYLERYLAGDHIRVWDELTALGDTVRDVSVLPDALSVAQATMERVGKNIDVLISRLASHGYEFGLYPDGTKFPTELKNVKKPTSLSLVHIKELETSVGPIPLSLKAFWEIVGSVSFIGKLHDGWPDYSDPLYIEEPAGGIAELRDWQADEYEGSVHRPFRCPIAPDVFHKDNVSGGPPYSIRLPDLGADALIQDDWHNIRFIPYLRIAIFEWGGFPGLSPANPQDKWRSKQAKTASPPWLTELTRNLVLF